MREIKFRGRSNGVFRTIDLTGSTGWAKELLELIAKGETQFKFDTPLEQFTGLHDKNGKEIYEGDIVRYDNGALHLVEWMDNQMDEYSYHTGFPLAFRSDTTEVAGNIHENAELAK